MIALRAKIASLLLRLEERIRGGKRLYEYTITLDYGKGEFGAVWYRCGYPKLKPGFEDALGVAFPEELRESMLHVAEDLEKEAKAIRGLYP